MPDKGMKEILKALPRILFMEHTRGLLVATTAQWGILDSMKILSRFIKKIGPKRLIARPKSLTRAEVIPEFFVSMWEVFDKREAIISGNTRLTFSEFKDRVLRLANALKAMGLRPKDRFAELLYNCNEFFEALFAGSFIGCPMPFLNWHMRGDELAEAINRSSPRILLLDEKFVDEVASIRDRLKTVEKFIVVGKKAPDDMILYEDLISKYPSTMPEKNFILALNPYTGGTTGIPKNVNYFDGFGYAMSNISEPPKVDLGEYLKLFIMEMSFTYWFDANKIKDIVSHNIRCLVPGPLYHAGVIVGWAPFLLLGATVVTMREFDPEEFLRLVERERINWVFIVPTMLERVLDLPDKIKGRYDLSSMKSLISAAAPATPELKKAANRFFISQGCTGNVFKEYYGSAETAITSVLLPRDYEENPRRYASVGKIRCAETRVYDSEKGAWCPPNKEGKVLTRSVITVSLRYMGTPEKLEDAFINVDGVPWFDDGLLGYMDADGFLYLTGRVKEMIISGGVNIYPNEIEAAIMKNPKVMDVAVVRYPDEDLGEVPAAVVQLKEGQEATSEEIIEHCKAHGLYGYKVPKVVDFTDNLPRHADGKLIKRVIEDKYWEGIPRRG